MIRSGLEIHKNVIMPTYVKDNRLKVYREQYTPLESLYMPVGYDGAVTDQMPSVGKKHYRKVYMDELENNQEIFKRETFLKQNIIRG
jgi:hypothetical protein